MTGGANLARLIYPYVSSWRRFGLTAAMAGLKLDPKRVAASIYGGFAGVCLFTVPPMCVCLCLGVCVCVCRRLSMFVSHKRRGTKEVR